MQPPDADLFPHATGAAKATVDAHSAEQSLKLYSGWFCPFVQRVWLVLEEKKIPYQYIEVNPYHKPGSLLKLNPRGLVPTLEVAGKPLYESNVICEFLEDAYPVEEVNGVGMRLRPLDNYEVANGRIWMDFVSTRVIPAFHRFLQWQPGETEKSVEDVRREVHEVLLQFAGAMDPKGPYFFGQEPMLVDFVMAPFAVRLWGFDEFKSGGFGAPREGEGGEKEGLWARWRKWLEVMEKRRSVLETTSEREHYRPIYKR